MVASMGLNRKGGDVCVCVPALFRMYGCGADNRQNSEAVFMFLFPRV